MRVKKFISEIKKIFSFDQSQQMTIKVPVENGLINANFKKLSKKDIQVNLDSRIKFDHGEIRAQALSDAPSSISFNLLKYTPQFKFCTSFLNEDQFPAHFKANYQHNISDTLIEQKIKSQFKVTPLTSESFDLQNFDFSYITKISNPWQSLRFEALHNWHVFTIEMFYHSRATFGGHVTYNNIGKHVVNAKCVLSANDDSGKTKFSVVSSFIKRSVNFYVSREVSDNIYSGIAIGANHLGHGPEFHGKVAFNYLINEESSVKFIYGSDLVISANFNVKFQDFLRLGFSASSPLGYNKTVENKFGANVIIDLSDRDVLNEFL